MSALYGILGYPVAHSRSPAMHNAAFRERSIDATYVRFLVEPARLRDAVKGLVALGVSGANVTVPHKESVLEWLDEVTPEARAIGAVNTIVRSGDKLAGHNTDAVGLVRSLEEASVPLAEARVVVLGAGGAARASVVGLAQRGATSVRVVARRLEQAAELIEAVRPACQGVVLSAHVMSREALEDAFQDATLLVQSTSATLEGAAHAMTFADSLPMDALSPAASVVDLVYKPRETTVLARARRRGLKAVDGLGMLLHQGAVAFELWTGAPAPLDVMRAALG